MKRLSEHPTPRGMPKYGYLLENDGVAVGVLLMIVSSRVNNGAASIRCNFSSFYVMPAYRIYASLLARQCARFKDVTYLNITPSPHTWPMLEAQGYRRFSDGLFIAVPALGSSLPNVQVKVATSEACYGGHLKPFEVDLLLAHASYGCASVICQVDDCAHPFVFGLRWKYGVPLAHLIYCRDQEDFVWLAGPLGRYLAGRGFPLVALDAIGPVRRLIGVYIAIRPKYWVGAERPPLGDLSYTERVMFGF